jgi:hypothetical protein
MIKMTTDLQLRGLTHMALKEKEWVKRKVCSHIPNLFSVIR